MSGGMLKWMIRFCTFVACIPFWSACWHESRPPLQVSDCSTELVDGNKSFVVYRFTLRNMSSNTIVASRIGYRPWLLPQSKIPYGETGLVRDIKAVLRPASSHLVQIHTGFLDAGERAKARHLRFGVSGCKPISVRYADGKVWVAEPGFAAPE